MAARNKMRHQVATVDVIAAVTDLGLNTGNHAKRSINNNIIQDSSAIFQFCSLSLFR